MRDALNAQAGRHMSRKMSQGNFSLFTTVLTFSEGIIIFFILILLPFGFYIASMILCVGVNFIFAYFISSEHWVIDDDGF